MAKIGKFKDIFIGSTHRESETGTSLRLNKSFEPPTHRKVIDGINLTDQAQVVLSARSGKVTLDVRDMAAGKIHFSISAEGDLVVDVES